MNKDEQKVLNVFKIFVERTKKLQTFFSKKSLEDDSGLLAAQRAAFFNFKKYFGELSSLQQKNIEPELISIARETNFIISDLLKTTQDLKLRVQSELLRTRIERNTIVQFQSEKQSLFTTIKISI
jgi:hypothetical protein